MVLFGATLMTVMAPLIQMQFLGSSLTFMMVYIWSRRNPFSRMNFLGIFNFTAPYLPWVLLSFSMLLGSDGIVDIVGIFVGHLYYFLEDVYPRMIPSRKRLLKTPRILELLFASDHMEGGEDFANGFDDQQFVFNNNNNNLNDNNNVDNNNNNNNNNNEVNIEG